MLYLRDPAHDDLLVADAGTVRCRNRFDRCENRAVFLSKLVFGCCPPSLSWQMIMLFTAFKNQSG
eukprot:COSAG06_NODE_1545_length_9134_cov_4.929939_1_plen_65_part_00